LKKQKFGLYLNDFRKKKVRYCLYNLLDILLFQRR